MTIRRDSSSWGLLAPVFGASLLLAACGTAPAAAPSTASPVSTSASGATAPVASAAGASSAAAAGSAAPARASTGSGSAAPAVASTGSQGTASAGVSTGSGSATPAAASTGSGQASPGAAGGTAINLAPDSSKLDIKMREVLAGNAITTDATESTQAVSGSIMLDGSGGIVSGSKISMDLRTLKSDRSTRDNFIKGRVVLDTGNFPSVEFVPTQVQGLDGPPPSSGSKTFQLIGNATVKGVTKPMTWDVTAAFNGQGCMGQATASFKLSDFGLKIPQLPSVLSVEDQGNLALTFQASKAAA